MPATSPQRPIPNTQYPIPSSTLTPNAAALAALCCVIWSGAYVAGKIAIGTPNEPGFGPYGTSFLRFSLCGILLFLYRRGRYPETMQIARSDWPTLTLQALLSVCLTYAFNYAGLALSNGTAAALIMPSEPVWIAILAVIFLKERLTRPRIIGIVCGLIGTILVVLSTQKPPTMHGTNESGNAALLGNLLMVFSLLFEASGVLIAKRLMRRYRGPSLLTYVFLIGSVMLFPFAAYESLHNGFPHPSPAALWAFLYLLGPCALFAYTLWYRLLETTDASELTIFIFLQPVLGAILGVLWKGDPFNAITFLGATFVLAGMAALLGVRQHTAVNSE